MDGILVISFGTSYKESREKTIDGFVDVFRENFPDTPVYVAFTSQIILRKIYKKEKVSIDTVEEAFKRMLAEGITRVFVQSTYIFHKVEKEDICYIIDKYRNLFPDGIYMGKPLLGDEEDYKRIISILLKELSIIDFNVSRETLDTAIILIGHKMHHDNEEYPINYHMIREMGYRNIYIGAAEGAPSAEFVLNEIEGLNIKNVILVPLFFLVGKHVIRDIAGIEQYSWKSIFESAGYNVTCIFKGMGEYLEIQKCYIEHLQCVMEKAK